MEKGQSKWKSFWEANTNTAIGFLLTLVISPIAYNIVGMKWTYNQLWQITAIFTLISVIRGYVIRRFFNKEEKRKEILLSQEIDILKNSVIDIKSNSDNWRKLYEDSRKRLAKIKEEYDFTIGVAKEYINETHQSKIKLDEALKRCNSDWNNLQQVANEEVLKKNLYRKQVDIFKEELDMCKHLHRAAVSDLVEGADYQLGEQSNKRDLEQTSDGIDGPY